MAGLGAFGGASLGTALAGTGTASAASAAGTGAAGTSTLGNIASAPLNLATPFSTLPAAATPAASTGYALNGSIMGSAPVAAPASVIRLPTLTAAQKMMPMSNFDKLAAGTKSAFSDPIAFAKANPLTTAGAGLGLYSAMQPDFKTPKQDQGMIRPYEFSRTQNMDAYDQGNPIYADDPGSSRERNYFTDQYTALTPYKAPGPEYEKAAGGGLMGLNAFQEGGPIENMSAMNTMGVGEPYPQSRINTPSYSTSGMQTPLGEEVLSSSMDVAVDPYTGEARFAKGGETTGGYKYDYNPQTQQFTQISAPQPKPIGLLSQIHDRARASGILTGPETFALTRGQYENTKAQNAPQQPIVTGGIAQAPQAQQQQQQQQQQPMYQPQQAAPIPAYQSPEQQLGLDGFYDYMNQQLGQMQQGYAGGGNVGGEYNLGGYSDGGRLLKGPGDGVSDSIPAVIGNRQPARLADGEFVIPARIVSELGNGSTEAGAKQLYAMMDRVQAARKKTIGKGKVAVNSRAEKLLPA
jgi:hypothetical protein